MPFIMWHRIKIKSFSDSYLAVTGSNTRYFAVIMNFSANMR
ncbi:hypothetical protein SALWKB2_2193 [Snodgrassella alvi wkB2]|nr:hypothetical protein SALWKB2_2193 [Snodgrassella alvi wkB2]